MAYIDMARERFSVRKFAEKPVEQEKIDLILEAARVAPTAANRQPQRIYVLRSEEAIEKARQVTGYIFNAPLVFLICYNVDEAWHNSREDGYHAGEMDASIICDQMMMEATDLGLGTLWVRGYATDELAAAFDLPENIIPACMLDVGYAADDCEPSPMHSSRRPLEETVTEL